MTAADAGAENGRPALHATGLDDGREMQRGEPGAYAALRLLLESSHGTEPDRLAGLIADACRRMGATDGVLYLIDYDQTTLAPLDPRRRTRLAPVPVEGTVAGRAFTEAAVQQGELRSGSTALWVPVVDGTDRLGVLRFDLAPAAQVDDALRDQVLLVATLVAELVAVRTLYGDGIERTRRLLPMTLPAEMQWRLLPPLTFASERVEVSGVLSPANAVAGDTFDYACNRDVLHLAVFDAMGHGLEATLMSAVAVAALRNARRTGLDLRDVVRSVDKAVASQFGQERFVTGVIGELHLRTGWYRWVNGGHPPVLIVRGGRVVKTLDRYIDSPFGLLGDDPDIGEERLQAGDRLLVYTDGVTEARTPDGELFGVDRLVDFIGREAAAGRPAAETMRRLSLAVVAHHSDVLDDDATTVMVEWRGAQD